jgi:hypothetical protein
MTFRGLILLAAASLAAGTQASAQALPALLASADCSHAAAEAAAETGGRVLSVASRSQDGRAVCVVTVLVPSDDGDRPRKRILVMPQ